MLIELTDQTSEALTPRVTHKRCTSADLLGGCVKVTAYNCRSDPIKIKGDLELIMSPNLM